MNDEENKTKEKEVVQCSCSTTKKVLIGLGIAGLIAVAGAAIYNSMNKKEEDPDDPDSSTIRFL
jgi:hypothetical protein